MVHDSILDIIGVNEGNKTGTKWGFAITQTPLHPFILDNKTASMSIFFWLNIKTNCIDRKNSKRLHKLLSSFNSHRFKMKGLYLVIYWTIQFFQRHKLLANSVAVDRSRDITMPILVTCCLDNITVHYCKMSFNSMGWNGFEATFCSR